VAKKKSVLKKSDPNWASITMQINETHFHAEGDKTEVEEKFNRWLDETLAPVGKLVKSVQDAVSK